MQSRTPRLGWIAQVLAGPEAPPPQAERAPLRLVAQGARAPGRGGQEAADPGPGRAATPARPASQSRPLILTHRRAPARSDFDHVSARETSPDPLRKGREPSPLTARRSRPRSMRAFFMNEVTHGILEMVAHGVVERQRRQHGQLGRGHGAERGQRFRARHDGAARRMARRRLRHHHHRRHRDRLHARLQPGVRHASPI